MVRSQTRPAWGGAARVAPPRRAAWIVPLLVFAFVLAAPTTHAISDDAAGLRLRQYALRVQLAHSAFDRPLWLDSTQRDGALTGNVYALVNYPFAVVRPALQGMGHWCDILILHLNVKMCAGQGAGANSVLNVAIGRKAQQGPFEEYGLSFAYRVVADRADFLDVRLRAEEGPFDTAHYRIVLQAIPVDEKHTFIRLYYAYDYGFAAALAMQTYLVSSGRKKVGFTVEGLNDDGAPAFIRGARGVIERNTMRYYLAIDAYLAAGTLPLARQPEQRLQNWFTAVEAYPRQLHELDRAEYVTMKRKEIARQQAAASP